MLKLGSFGDEEEEEEGGGGGEKRRRKSSDGTWLAFPVLQTNKLIPETAFSRDENSIITVIVVTLIIQYTAPPFFFHSGSQVSCRWAGLWIGMGLMCGWGLPREPTSEWAFQAINQPHGPTSICIGPNIWVGFIGMNQHSFISLKAPKMAPFVGRIRRIGGP